MSELTRAQVREAVLGTLEEWLPGYVHLQGVYAPQHKVLLEQSAQEGEDWVLIRVHEQERDSAVYAAEPVSRYLIRVSVEEAP